MNIWVNGCFDILHTGHLELLEFAKHSGNEAGHFNENYLIVGIDSDKRVRELKGIGRPINSVKDRKKILEAIRHVDEVIVFDTANELRQLVKDKCVDIMVVGDHYRDKEVIGSENAKRGVVFYPTDDRSTTNIIEKIKNL